MNRRSLSLILALAAALVAPASQANDIEPGKDKYTAAYTLTPITVDGNLSEWAGVGVIADPKFAVPKGTGTGANPNYVLFEEYNGGTWTGPDDQTSAVQVVYDEDNVYFGFVVTDDYHENSANSAWNGDSIQLMIADGNRSAQVALYNYALGGVEEELGELVEANRYEAGPAANPDCDCLTEVAIVRNTSTKKTYYEIKLPAKSLGLTVPLSPGTKFGLGMAINDGDADTPGQRGWGGLGAHALVFGKSPSETAEVTLGPNAPTYEVLGIGTEALIGGDLTDPENDGNEDAGPTDPSWNWVSISSNNEPGFGGGEFSYNIFDNLVGGGNDKWCCDDPTPDNPLWVAVEFPQPVSLAYFTITSGNDTPDRRPTKWQIQGSNDGTSYTPIFVQDAPEAIWTEHNEVIKITLPMPSVPFRYLRYFVTETPGTLHQINEIEYFGTFGGSALAYYSSVNPTINGFSFRLTDVGASVVDPTSIQLVIDGTAIDIGTPTKVDGVIDVSYTSPSPFLPKSAHSYQITAQDEVGNNITTQGEWNTASYALLTAADKVTADTSKPGFIWRVHQNDLFQANDAVRPVQQLKGLLGENRAEPFNRGVAIGDGVPESGTVNNLGNMPVRFEIATVINLSQVEFEENGDFIPDDQMPGIPGQDFTDNGIAAEVTTYIQLPAGRHVFAVTSDDGFQTFAGQLDDVFRAQLAGQNPGAVANNVRFTVYVEEDGVYPFRTIWEEGGGGAHLELKTEKADGSPVLINDTANGGFAAYRAISGAAKTAVTSVSPAPDSAEVAPNANFTVVITEGGDTVDLASVKLSIDNAQVAATATRSGSTVTVSYDPAEDLRQDSQHSASLTFSAGGVERTDSWSFRVPPVTLDSVAQRAGFILGAATFTEDGGGRSGQSGDYAMDFGGTAGNTVHVPDVSFLNTATANQQLTFSFWEKLHGVQNSSAFWVRSPSSTSNARGWQAHVPWGDGTIYFDTSGCCDADVTRISLNIDQLPSYTGDASWWQQWHHFVFQKLNTGDKMIWIDGEFFHVGFGDPLKTDWTDMFIGSESATASTINGIIDDLAIFSTALTETQIQALASGTAPAAVSGNPGLVAHWAFNDPPEPSGEASIAVARDGANVVITFEGTLESATSVTGPWSAEAGATSPATVSATGDQKYYRARN